jgi:hypothetical protein
MSEPAKSRATQAPSREHHAIVRGIDLGEVFSINVLAKILQVAERGLSIQVRGSAIEMQI